MSEDECFDFALMSRGLDRTREYLGGGGAALVDEDDYGRSATETRSETRLASLRDCVIPDASTVLTIMPLGTKRDASETAWSSNPPGL